MTAKAGLVPIQKLVIRHGQQFMTTVYVNPNKANKVDHTKHVVVPAWHLRTAQDLEDEKNKIAKTKDPAEKEALKDEFMKHLESMGVKWTKNPNDGINYMRALMAAKDHLNTQGNSTPTAAPTPAPQATPTPQAPTPAVGGQKMSKDDAKKLIKDMQKKDSVENIMAKMKAQGITWNEHANPAVNKMRAMMALNSHLQNGGTLGGSAQPTPAPQAQPTAPAPPKAPVTVQAKKVDKSAPKAGTIEADYHNASIRAKAIGLLTGMVPKDVDAENFLHKQIKDGKFDVDPSNGSGNGSDEYGLPKGMLALLSKNGRVSDYMKKDDFNAYTRPNGHASEIFKDKGKKEFEDYKKTFEDYRDKYGTYIMDDKLSYVKSVSGNLDIMDSYGMHVDANKTGQEYHKDLQTVLNKLANANTSQAEIDQAWDKLGMDTFLNKYSLTDSAVADNPAMQQMMEFGFGGACSEMNFVQEKFMDELGKNSWNDLKTVLQDVQQGKRGKKQVFVALSNAVENARVMARLDGLSHTMANGSQKNMWKEPLISSMMDQDNLAYFGRRDLPKTEKYFKTFHDSGTTTFNRAKFDDFINGAVTDRAGLVSPEAKWVKHNLLLYNATLQASGDSYNGKFKMPDNYEPVDFNDWMNSSDKIDCFRRHMAIMRKAESTRDKWRKKYTPQQGSTPKVLDKQAIHDAIKNGGDLSQLYIPEHKDLGGMVKCAIEKAPDSEKETVQKKINENHDTINHSSFRTKVHNVFRVTNLPYEEKFQEIDKDRDNTGFYYHGTDYRAMQLILGKSGQFVVNKTNVKAGRMLGDGVYLAKQSSKSMQYISSGFNRGIGNRGVLFLCKASLGKAVESTVRGSQYNTKLLDQKGVDTVYMLKPHVVNPEWAVKEEKAVIPRLIIDVEMTNP